MSSSEVDAEKTKKLQIVAASKYADCMCELLKKLDEHEETMNRLEKTFDDDDKKIYEPAFRAAGANAGTDTANAGTDTAKRLLDSRKLWHGESMKIYKKMRVWYNTELTAAGVELARLTATVESRGDEYERSPAEPQRVEYANLSTESRSFQVD